jgi:hypothetical protein
VKNNGAPIAEAGFIMFHALLIYEFQMVYTTLQRNWFYD